MTKDELNLAVKMFLAGLFTGAVISILVVLLNA